MLSFTSDILKLFALYIRLALALGVAYILVIFTPSSWLGPLQYVLLSVAAVLAMGLIIHLTDIKKLFNAWIPFIHLVNVLPPLFALDKLAGSQVPQNAMFWLLSVLAIAACWPQLQSAATTAKSLTPAEMKAQFDLFWRVFILNFFWIWLI